MRSSVAVLPFGAVKTEAAFAVASVGNRVLAERGGRLLFAFTEYPIAPVQVVPEYRWDATVRRLYGNAPAFAPAWDFQRFGYLLVHVLEPDLAQLLTLAMAPEAELVGAEGEWLLFRATHPPLPLTSPDAPLPRAPPDGVRERVLRLEGL
jgi:hypothetical protein